MREIVLDTETTGISPQDGHRIIEIGAVELNNHLPTGNFYHTYINPEREVPQEASAVHGIVSEFLIDKPKFFEIKNDLLNFLKDSPLIIHNATFDLGFLNSEFKIIGSNNVLSNQIIDTLKIARQKHPMASNSLDALCKRYGINNSKRKKHGALLDSEILAEVYIELIGGRQTSLGLNAIKQKDPLVTTKNTNLNFLIRKRLSNRITHQETEDYLTAISKIGEKAIWKKY